MKTFVRLHGGRLKRQRHRFGGDVEHWKPEWRFSWRPSVRVRDEHQFVRLIIVEALSPNGHDEPGGITADPQLVRIVSCGQVADDRSCSRREGFQFIIAPSTTNGQNGHRTFRHPWRPKRRLVRIIDEAMKVANEYSY